MPRRKHPGPTQVDEDLRIKWTPPRKDLLITFIETHPCFWDNSAEGGTDPDYKDGLVLDFTTNILQLGVEAVPAVWRHINTMKDTYTRNLAKYVASGSQGGPSRLTPKMREFMDRFSFYQRSIELRQSKSNLPPAKKGHSHFHAKVFRTEIDDQRAPLDEPQSRLGDPSDRWMSWEPKAPMAVPDHIGDSTEDDESSEEDSSLDSDEPSQPEVNRDRKTQPILRDDLGDDLDENLDLPAAVNNNNNKLVTNDNAAIDDNDDKSSVNDESHGETSESKVLPLPSGVGSSIQVVDSGRSTGESAETAATLGSSVPEGQMKDEPVIKTEEVVAAKAVQGNNTSTESFSPITSSTSQRVLVSKEEEEVNLSSTASTIASTSTSHPSTTVKPHLVALPDILAKADVFDLPLKSLPPFPETDLCASVYCHYGRVCEKGVCVCAPSDYCRGHTKAVCGTDGVTYPSHCELHRMACVNRRHIGIDHSGKRCLLVTTGRSEPKQVETFVFDDLSLRRDESQVVAKKSELQSQQDTLEPAENFQEDRLEVNLEKPRPYMEQTQQTQRACTELEYDQLKTNLMRYHCARIGEPDCSANSPRKQFVANIMFNYYDRNNNQALDEAELQDVSHRDHLEKLSRFCGLADMLTFDDRQEDGNISLPEFYNAFDVPTVLLDEDLKVFTTRVTAGNSIELKCDIRGAVEIVWKRNGGLLDDTTAPEIKTFDDGSLYISNIGLHHMGNYTCQDRYNDHVIQTHILHVQLAPRVRVSPSTQFHTSGSSVTLKCHADGVPEPEMIWEMNEAPLSEEHGTQHYMRLHNNATLEIREAIYTKDTGAYKCKARNSAGTGQDIATVFIENSNVPKYYTSEELYEVFLVFHDKGYTAYEPSHCHIEHQVSGSFSMFKLLPEYGNTLPTLCPEEGDCSWGDAVNVKNKFIYISQPKLNRVVVIEIQDRSNPVEIIPTDKVPVQVHYIEHLDQVWVLCWNSESEVGAKTIVVIRQASEDTQHHTVHTQPIANRFDLVRDMFLPPNNDLQHRFPHGYIVHMEQRGLYKLDLASMKYTKNIDLTKYNCVPKSVSFIAMGGQVHVHCVNPDAASGTHKSWHIVLDYVTDAVLSEYELTGDSYVSPDGRYLVIVDDEGDTITVNKILDNGLMTKVYDEYTNLRIAGVTFFPSERGRGYDFYASSINKNDVLYMNLASGKVEMIEGVGQAIKPEEWKWSRHNRVIVSGGVFGEYLMTPSRNSIVVIDGRRRHVQCEWQDISHGNIIVWVEPMHL